jgi:pimeloyl-ACP methyl ester carboxylesterase
MPAPTIVFVHGMYMTPACWDSWRKRLGAQGYECLAPAWPGRDRSVADLRRDAESGSLAKLSLSDVIERHASLIAALPRKPIVIGHSMGGLVAQLLLQRGLVAAAVAVSSAPPQGVLALSWPFLKANWGHANPFVSKSRPVAMSFERFQYCFTNGLPLAQQRAAYETYVVPESRRVPAESLTATAHVDFRKPGAPLLMIAGADDHLIPAALNRANYRKYQRPGSVTELLEFAGRTHFIIGQDGWEEVADATTTWLERVGVGARAVS